MATQCLKLSQLTKPVVCSLCSIKLSPVHYNIVKLSRLFHNLISTKNCHQYWSCKADLSLRIVPSNALTKSCVSILSNHFSKINTPLLKRHLSSTTVVRSHDGTTAIGLHEKDRKGGYGKVSLKRKIGQMGINNKIYICTPI